MILVKFGKLVRNLQKLKIICRNFEYWNFLFLFFWLDSWAKFELIKFPESTKNIWNVEIFFNESTTLSVKKKCFIV